MSREDKPLEYQRRIRDTKGVAQRLDLEYLKRPRLLAVLRARLTWILVAAALLAGVPLVLGVGGSRGTVANGPVSEAHALFAERCEVCHAQAFKRTPDRACRACHDGAPHPAKPMDTAKVNDGPACAQCHVEHRGKMALREVASNNCTGCHADLAAQASGVRGGQTTENAGLPHLKIKAAHITGFAPETHPEFSTAAVANDARPIKLNHAAHMPAQAKEIRGIKLPMKCADCHVADRNSKSGELQAVTFEQNCRKCHARELEFDVYHVLGANAPPSPHTKDLKTIHDFIESAYRAALAADPGIARRPLGNELAVSPNWLDRVVKDSENYLFTRKCGYCHELTAYATVKPVNRIAGRYVEGKAEGDPWLPRGEFAHRSHRAVECESCHAAARTSKVTSDVLLPAMKSCTPCHAKAGTGLDRCSLCHVYHNRDLERDRERRPTGELVGELNLDRLIISTLPFGSRRQFSSHYRSLTVAVRNEGAYRNEGAHDKRNIGPGGQR